MRALSLSLRLWLSLALAAWVFVAAVPVSAQGPRAEPKLALVIGNSAYREAPLRNPANDARAMAQTLRELGFTVLAHENTTKRAMETAILEFGRRLADGGVGFFYYAGHGLQVRGRNYLMQSTPRSIRRRRLGSPLWTWICRWSRWPRRRIG